MNAVWNDNQYLFRLTSTFGWEEAVHLCNEFINEIEQIVARSSAKDESSGRFSNRDQFNDSLSCYGSSNSEGSKTLDDWLFHAGSQLMYQDQWGNTPLHAASYVQPPVNVIDALLRLGRLLWKYRTKKPKMPIWAAPSKDSSTPFLVACSTGTDFTGIQRYLDEVEYYIEQSWMPSCARMLVLQPDSQGTSPLMGWMAFHHGFISQEKTPARSIQRVDILRNYVELITRILWFATMHFYPAYPSTEEMVLLRCTLMALQFPEPLLSFMLADANKRDVAAAKDHINRLPLHNAIMSVEIVSKIFDDAVQVNDESDNFFSSQDPQFNQNHERNRLFIIDDLLKWYPDAARQNFPESGRSLLCEALARGDQWYHVASNQTTQLAGVIQMLSEKAPDKLEERDTETGLYPFMLAASTSPSSNRANDLSVVDTIYQLLRSHPQPIYNTLL